MCFTRPPKARNGAEKCGPQIATNGDAITRPGTPLDPISLLATLPKTQTMSSEVFPNVPTLKRMGMGNATTGTGDDSILPATRSTTMSSQVSKYISVDIKRRASKRLSRTVKQKRNSVQIEAKPTSPIPQLRLSLPVDLSLPMDYTPHCRRCERPICYSLMAAIIIPCCHWTCTACFDASLEEAELQVACKCGDPKKGKKTHACPICGELLRNYWTSDAAGLGDAITRLKSNRDEIESLKFSPKETRRNSCTRSVASKKSTSTITFKVPEDRNDPENNTAVSKEAKKSDAPKLVFERSPSFSAEKIFDGISTKTYVQ